MTYIYKPGSSWWPGKQDEDKAVAAIEANEEDEKVFEEDEKVFEEEVDEALETECKYLKGDSETERCEVCKMSRTIREGCRICATCNRI